MKDAFNKNKIDQIKNWLGSGSINIFGLPFSGKDTHGHQLTNILGGELIGGGDILRSESGPQHIKDHIAKGNLAPTDEFLQIVLPFLSQKKYANTPLILSTVGRWHGEEESVIRAARDSGHPVKAVIFLRVDKDEVIKRYHLSQRKADRSHRQDDDLNVLNKRFQEFEQKTLPVIEFYRKLGLLIEVDGSPPISSVNNEILDKLTLKAASGQS